MKRILGLSRFVSKQFKFNFSNIRSTEDQLILSLDSLLKQSEQNLEIDATISEVLEEQKFVLNSLSHKNIYELHKKVQNADVYINFQPKWTQQSSNNQSPELKDQDEQDAQDESEPSEFAVYIVKENTSLMFDCQSMDGELNINQVTYFPDFDIVKSSDSVYNSPNHYSGPEFSSLDERLQQSFYEYLKQHGVNEDTISIIEHLQMEKEQEKYLEWMKNLKQYASK